MFLVSRTSIFSALATFRLPIGWNGTRLPMPPLVYPFKEPVFAALRPAATGAVEIWTVGVTGGEDVNVPRSANCQLLTMYLAAALSLCVRVGAQTKPKPTRWRKSRTELPFSWL